MVRINLPKRLSDRDLCVRGRWSEICVEGRGRTGVSRPAKCPLFAPRHNVTRNGRFCAARRVSLSPSFWLALSRPFSELLRGRWQWPVSGSWLFRLCHFFVFLPWSCGRPFLLLFSPPSRTSPSHSPFLVIRSVPAELLAHAVQMAHRAADAGDELSKKPRRRLPCGRSQSLRRPRFRRFSACPFLIPLRSA